MQNSDILLQQSHRCIKLDNSIRSIHHCETGIEITKTNERLNQLPLHVSMREPEGGEDKGRESTASVKTLMTTTAVRQGEQDTVKTHYSIVFKDTLYKDTSKISG